MLFEAEDETGEVQSFKRTLYLIKKELEDKDANSAVPEP